MTSHPSQPAAAPLRSVARIAALALVLALAGCASLLGGGGGDRERSTIYAPDPRPAPDPAWPRADWQLTLSPPTAARMTDSFRIAVRPTPGELQVYRGATWAKTPTDMLHDSVLRMFEDSDRIAAVARQGAGITADYKLVIDLRRFEADYNGNLLPTALIEANIKLIHNIDQTVAGARTFLVAEPASGTDVAQVVDAFDAALGTISGQVVGWTLTTGNAHEATTHPDARAR
ncbi:ABC-type transport auxiliary lipoprotein family protein [Luteimonas sp. BDR2-5]|uniref:ABC-type transport auxiliary lipoprotein family protein n=1 Tax=Proluteimonas luteida TaxID=2878685 RepID=UPI001E638041|nr:ABC-type transport auxiliary lipoprotein family protein [Luteimonas sp. BDR2-5]MCD9027321.1 ABC-type transport auxiliary lipoprotein family protein [Luteimonas sp. BDR2-5]